MIGIFDSGIGGLTVVKQISRYLPGYKIVYLGDTARFPYTTKSLNNKIAFSLQDAKFLMKQGAKILLIACNTITASAGQIIRKKISIPVFDIVSAGAYSASIVTKKNMVGLIGSRDTIESNIYKTLLKKINPHIKLFSKATQLLIYLVEENYIRYPETEKIVKKFLDSFKKTKIDTLILGCTHFPYLAKEIRKSIRKNVQLIDPAIELALQVKKYINENIELKSTMTLGQEHKFFISGDIDNFQKAAKKILNIEIKKPCPLNWSKEDRSLLSKEWGDPQ